MPANNVVQFTGITRHDYSVKSLLDFAKEDLIDKDAPIKGAAIIGYDENGEIYFTSTYADCAEILWLLERAKTRIMDGPRYREFDLSP